MLFYTETCTTADIFSSAFSSQWFFQRRIRLWSKNYRHLKGYTAACFLKEFSTKNWTRAQILTILKRTVCYLYKLIILLNIPYFGLLNVCYIAVNKLDMRINFKKSGCLRVGSRCDITCAAIASSDGCSLPWVSELRYLGVFITQSKTLKCSLDSACLLYTSDAADE